ncbi:adenylyltransferase/cytidyltransferase family protein [Spirochaeta lutea]|uniref:adenylyltransferase/cytidyltransferase family protein n=1 Tax=Spirochaeta lutea TaxID=1480694 RepID=UPI00068EDBF4|nr:adenylyltransferase/cytidyltransferase family protein [Spirochaeta lutea]
MDTPQHPTQQKPEPQGTPHTTGAIIGRFMPPHNGHRYLIDFAQGFVDHLTVFLCSLPDEPIPGELRERWMQELFPQVTLVHFTQAIPEAHRDNPHSPSIWAQAMKPHLPQSTDYLFASESYGENLAKALGARFIPVDPSRNQIAVSASLIRKSPLAYWSYIPPPVRPYFVRRILVIAGSKSEDIAQHLSEVFSTVYLPHYTSRSLQNHELESIHAAQWYALSRQANRLIFYPQNPNSSQHSTLAITPPGLPEPHLILVFEQGLSSGDLHALKTKTSDMNLPIHYFDKAVGINLEVLKHRILAEFHQWGLDSL